MDANMALLTLQGKVPSESLPLLQDKLKSANDSQLEKISLISLKSPLLGLVLGFFLGAFGVDRFYKGDVILGIAKIATLIVGFLTTFIIIGNFILFALWIWCIVDFFLVWKGIKRDNLNRILMQL